MAACSLARARLGLQLMRGRYVAKPHNSNSFFLGHFGSAAGERAVAQSTAGAVSFASPLSAGPTSARPPGDSPAEGQGARRRSATPGIPDWTAAARVPQAGLPAPAAARPASLVATPHNMPMKLTERARARRPARSCRAVHDSGPSVGTCAERVALCSLWAALGRHCIGSITTRGYASTPAATAVVAQPTSRRVTP